MVRTRWRRAGAADRGGAISRAAAVVALLCGTLLGVVLVSGVATGGGPAASAPLAGAVLAGAVLAAALLLHGSAAMSMAAAASMLPQLRLARTLRAKARATAFLRVTDPAAPGRSRPRAPSAAQAAAAR